MIYTKVLLPVWANKDHTIINCLVTFELIGQVQFTASKNDTDYSNEIFTRCLNKEFGDIVEYIEPVVLAAKNQPIVIGTQSL